MGGIFVAGGATPGGQRLATYNELMDRLRGITRAAGYNTQPRICDDQPTAEKSTATVSIWVTAGPEEFGEPKILGGGQPSVLTLQIHAYIRKTTNLTITLEEALQDVRNACQANYETWKTKAGVTMTGFDTCETDEGILAYDGRAFFTQPVVYIYNAGPTW